MRQERGRCKTATIAGRTVTFGLPENDTRRQNVTLGEAWDGTFKFFKLRGSTKFITIPIRGLTTTNKEALLDDLEADANYQVNIVPDSHVDLGNGAGVLIVAQWIDRETNFVKTTHDFWSGSLSFIYVS